MRHKPALSVAPPPQTGTNRRLVHLLNQRYRREYDRAEQLAAELADIKASRAWRFLVWLRRARQRLRLGTATPRPASDEGFGETLDCPPPAGRSASVSIVIPFKDQVRLLRACVASVLRSTHRRVEMILVDNGSRERATQRYLERFHGRRGWQVRAAPGPFNFARLCNLGAEKARGDYLLFLNNDIEVLTPDWLEQLVVVARQPRVGIVGATLLYPDFTIQHAGIVHDKDRWFHAYRGCPSDHAGERGELRQVRTVPAVTGACLLIARKLFAELNGFDEQLPLTHNDVDLCRRAAESGWLTAVTPHARILHYESLTRGYSKERSAR